MLWLRHHFKSIISLAYMAGFQVHSLHLTLFYQVMVDVSGDDREVLGFTFGAERAFVELIEDCLVRHRNHDGGSGLFLALIVNSGLCWKKLVSARLINLLHVPGGV